MAVHEIDDRTTVVGWARTARIAGLTAGIGLLLQTLLFLLDATGVLPFAPDFRETSAGREQDLATFYAPYLERQHDVVWDIALRDLIGPVAAIALIVLARALVRLRGGNGARVEVWALVLAVGALLKMLSDLVYLSEIGLWRLTGFTPETPADIIAVGRSGEAIDRLSGYLENTAYLTLAVSLVGLAGVLGRRLALLARVVAVFLVVLVVAWWMGLEVTYQIAALVTGVLLAPAFVGSLGLWLARPDQPAGDPSTAGPPSLGAP